MTSPDAGEEWDPMHLWEMSQQSSQGFPDGVISDHLRETGTIMAI